MTTEKNDVCKAMIDGAIASFRSNKGWADKAIAQLSDDKLHVALDPNTNSIAVIMKLLSGILRPRKVQVSHCATGRSNHSHASFPSNEKRDGTCPARRMNVGTA